MSTIPRHLKWLLLLVFVAVDVVCLWILREAHAENPVAMQVYILRTGIVIASIGAWFTSQSLIGTRAASSDPLRDGMHVITTPLLQYLQSRPRLVQGILIVSSGFIDLFGVFLIGISIFGPTIRPFVSLLILFAMRQTCQGLCALPAPPGMIWRNPGIPSLLVTYKVENDFFFSGHTSMAILGAAEIARIAPWWLGAAAVLVAFFEMATVLVLRAHYTMDVVAAVLAAFFAMQASAWIFSLL